MRRWGVLLSILYAMMVPDQASCRFTTSAWTLMHRVPRLNVKTKTALAPSRNAVFAPLQEIADLILTGYRFPMIFPRGHGHDDVLAFLVIAPF